MAKNLPAPENFRRHWEVQKRHSGALAPLLETLFESESAPSQAKKRQNAPQFFFQKNATIFT